MEKDKKKRKEKEEIDVSFDDKLDQIIEMKKSENSALKKIYASLTKDKTSKNTKINKK